MTGRVVRVARAGEMVVALDARACRALWCEVLLLAWNDAFGQKLYAGPDTDRSRAWFGTGNFHKVCALAGLDGEAVLSAFRAKMGAA